MLTKTRNRRIGEILVDLGYCTEEQIAHALEIQAQHPGKMLGRLLVETNSLTDKEVFQAVQLQWEDWLKGNPS